MEVTLNGRGIESREALHAALAEGLCFPEWYGGNLDAMFDCLTDIGEDTTIRVLEPEALEETLGAYGELWLRVLREAEEVNPRLHVLTDSPELPE